MTSDTDVAIIGMSGRFPGAKTVDELWRNLCDGVDAITSFSEPEAPPPGVDPAALRGPAYVKAAAILDDIELFDAGFFGIDPKDAAIIDPQQRLLLECAWEAIEAAGYDPARYDGAIGVFAGTAMNRYLLTHLWSNPEVLRHADALQAMLANDKDFAATRISYKLGLRGPSVNVQTACSTSLVAVHLACQSLVNGECDMAIAGAAAIQIPQRTGYLHAEGGMASPDGRCRVFDAKAGGTVKGSGAGAVVLKRLADARRDGDAILAVIKGSAVNNDGASKVGFTAPSVEGQSEVIAEALEVAGVDADAIGYVEAHGSGTLVGDSVEVAALTRAFRATTRRRGFCALGSVKSNIGNVDTAAGMAGLIKAVLALVHRRIPPSLHFEEPNPEIDLASSPFYVSTRLAEWTSKGPRRAGVSSFGIGGTNAHVVLEEAQSPSPTPSARGPQILALSARTPEALDAATRRLARYLRENPGVDLADVAYTLSVGRRAFAHRRALVCNDVDDVIASLAQDGAPRVITGHVAQGREPLAGVEGARASDLDLVARRWVVGGDVDFERIHASGRRRVHLPTYPFQRTRCWIEPPRAGGRDEGGSRQAQPAAARASADRGRAIAIVGAAGRFPGAKSVRELWENLRNGVESIRFLGDDAPGIDAARRADPNFVKATASLEDVERFDAQLFGYSPSEAEYLDPQIRVFLEVVLEALENAGYAGETQRLSVGLFGSASTSTYLFNIFTSANVASTSAFQVTISNGCDALTTSASYRLDLRGPSVDVQTFCSSSLVALHLARQSLLAGECDVALAGGVSINLGLRSGYPYQEGGIFSPDGHCRAFDASGGGTVFGDGAGAVVLRRLDDAIRDGDRICAVILGSAINNDGIHKAGYTAPSVDGQTEVILRAYADAGVAPESVSYVEAHGTATRLGDPIEIGALTRAFRASTAAKGFCAIGSVKTNVGHLDRAAGVTSVIKTMMALERGEIPPSLHFEEPNPEIDFANSPFYVSTRLTPWERDRGPRRAGVTALGIGGTNVHVIMEEPPEVAPSGPSRPWQLLVMSAKTRTALEATAANLAAHLRERPDLDLADVAHTLGVGRRAHRSRRAIVCRDAGEAIAALGGSASIATSRPRQVVFQFSGQGSQHPNMGLELYQREPRYRAEVDRCCEILKNPLGLDLREILFVEGDVAAAAERLRQTAIAQPALFVTEHALAQLWMSWGVRPAAMIGHSIGEYVAACVAGVFSLEDALLLVAERGRLMQQMPVGAMAAVMLSEREVLDAIGPELCLAAVNAPELCVIAGPSEAVRRTIATLQARGVGCSLLHTSHAFHSPSMAPMIPAFVERVRAVKMAEPRIPFVSNVTGEWIRPEDATSPAYWGRHAREAVRFARGIDVLCQAEPRALLEIGPGGALTSLARARFGARGEHVAVSSMRAARDEGSDLAHLLGALGALWSEGVDVDWHAFRAGERRRRVELPTYPFERQSYWIQARELTAVRSMEKKPDAADWFYAQSWERTPPPSPTSPRTRWLVFVDERGLGRAVADRLIAAGDDVIQVAVGPTFVKVGAGEAMVDPRSPEDCRALLRDARGRDPLPLAVAHFWAMDEARDDALFASLLALMQALDKEMPAENIEVNIVTAGLQEVTGDEAIRPRSAVVLGICRVAPKELLNLKCRSIDVGSSDGEPVVQQLARELRSPIAAPVVAFRGRYRWQEMFKPLHVDAPSGRPARVRDRGVYVITGGLGGIGIELADYLARAAGARLVLMGRSPFPDRARWGELIEADPRGVTASKVRRLMAMEEAGAEITTAAADVTDLEATRAVFEATRARYGRIDGVIHAAGVPGGGIIRAKTPEATRRIMDPKVVGALNLERILEGMPLDFFVLCSSLSSVTGDFAQVDYCAANAFLDSFARYHTARTGTFTLSIGWTMWNEVGMGVDIQVPENMKVHRMKALEGGLTSAEGADVFARLLDLDTTRVIVSTQDLEACIEVAAMIATGDAKGAQGHDPTPRPAQPRSDLGSAYAAPSTDVERALVETWQRLLGVEPVGVDDNFFELGGNSLMAMQLLPELRKRFSVSLGAADLFEGPTIRHLAGLIAGGDDTGAVDERRRRGERIRRRRRSGPREE